MPSSPRIRINTDHPEIGKYVFSNQEGIAQYNHWVERYAELSNKAYEYGRAIREAMQFKDRKEFKTNLSPEERQELKSLREKIIEFQEEHRGKFRSVLSKSDQELFLASGQDNLVYEYSIDREAGPEKGSYIYKYSVDSYPATPHTVEYLQKKYKMLRRFLGPVIPKSHFILGERYQKFDSKKLIESQKATSVHAMTLQKRVRGKTFQDMTLEEKESEQVLKDLNQAHKKYIALKKLLRLAARQLGLPEDTLDAKLDIGRLSKHENMDIFDPAQVRTFTSPNIMYDSDRHQLYFIDFDMNEWNADKQKVFDLIMSDEMQAEYQKLLQSA